MESGSPSLVGTVNTNPQSSMTFRAPLISTGDFPRRAEIENQVRIRAPMSKEADPDGTPGELGSRLCREILSIAQPPQRESQLPGSPI